MSLLEMSFYGAVIILTIVVIRALTLHKLPKKFFLILWGVALFRLLIPFEINSGLSLYSHVPNELSGQLTSMQHESADPVSHSENIPAPEILIPDSSSYPYTGIVVLPESTSFFSFTFIQITGTLLLATFFLIAYLKCYTEFRTSLPVREEYTSHWLSLHPLKRKISIRQSDKITAPLTYGVLRPVILLPKNTDWEDKKQLDYILYHEYTHIRRFDLVTKLVMVAALCLHWFNPLVWVMYLLFNRDIELACDECVVKHSKGQEKTAYALTLISMEEKKLYFAPLCNNFSKNAIEERITAIMKLKKTTWGAILLGVLLIIVLVITLMTSAKETGGSDHVPPTPFPTVTATPTPTPKVPIQEEVTTSSPVPPKAGSPEALLAENNFPRNGYSTPHKLNIRSGAGYSYPVLTTIPTKTTVNILAVEQDPNNEYWYQVSVSLSGKTLDGYINSQYIIVGEVGSTPETPETPENLMASATFPQIGYAVPTRLNVRVGAGYEHAIMTRIENNTSVSILEVVSSSDGEYWYLVSFVQNGETVTGYVNSLYILVTNALSTEGTVQITPNGSQN